MSQVDEDRVLDKRGLAKARIEALSDGIFAVAMTLLVLDIKLPSNLNFETGPSSSPTSWRSSTASPCI